VDSNHLDEVLMSACSIPHSEESDKQRAGTEDTAAYGPKRPKRK
jgi:hypothetical protein